MEALKAHSSLAPQQQIGKYATLLTEKVESLSEEDKARYAVLAEQWKEKGPPQEVKRRLVLYVEILWFSLLTGNK